MLLLFNFCSFLFIGHNGYFPLLVYAHIVILTHFLLRLFRCCCSFFFKQAVQGIFRMEEIYHTVAQQLDDERTRRVSAVQTRSEERRVGKEC